VTGIVDSPTEAGAIQDTVSVTAELANCAGGPPGQPRAGSMRGAATLVGPRLIPPAGISPS
jgi:hypothetical protein